MKHARLIYLFEYYCIVWVFLAAARYCTVDVGFESMSGAQRYSFFAEQQQQEKRKALQYNPRVPKCEIFRPLCLTSINPIWVGDFDSWTVGKD